MKVQSAISAKAKEEDVGKFYVYPLADVEAGKIVAREELDAAVNEIGERKVGYEQVNELHVLGMLG